MVAIDRGAAREMPFRPGSGPDSRLVERHSTLPLLILFVIVLMIPVSMSLGGLLLTPLRLFLLIAIVPYAVMIVSGKIGRFTKVDLLVLLHGIWIFVALIMAHGMERIAFAGINAVELVGGYFVGRALVRSPEDYRRLFLVILIALLCVLPFAIYENFTGTMLIPDMLRTDFFETPHRAKSAYGRMGLERVYGVFPHPILWGLFCSLTLANFVILARGNVLLILMAIGFSCYTTMLSLSSAPLLSCSMQLILLFWGWAMGGRWKLLLIVTAVAYVAVDMASNRTPVSLLIGTLTFNPMSGYIRLNIFDYGWASVRRSPIFGNGFNDWPRPWWLTKSVDNFWLLVAMRYGMVGAGLLILAFAANIWFIARARIDQVFARQLRVGYLITLSGLCLSLATVHIWGSVAVFVMFYLGAGAWLYLGDYRTPDGSAPDPEPAPEGLSRYSRFAQLPRGEAREVAHDAAREMPPASAGFSRRETVAPAPRSELRPDPASDPAPRPGGSRP